MIEKPFQHVARVAVLSGGDVGRTNLAPDLLLRVCLIALHNLLEVADGFGQTALGAGDASQLIMRIQLVLIEIKIHPFLRSLPVVMKAAANADWSIVSTLVWDKDWIGPGGSVGLRPAYELVALLPMPDFAVPDRGIPDVWTMLETLPEELLREVDLAPLRRLSVGGDEPAVERYRRGGDGTPKCP